MRAPIGISDVDLRAMNDAARVYAWQWYNKGVLMAVEGLRAGIADGYRPTHAELVALCELLEQKARTAGEDMKDESKRDPERDAFTKLDPLTRHYCPDWDGMAIDAGCPEYECCSCADATRSHEPTSD